MINRLAIVGGSIVTRDEVIENGVALCEDSYIKAVGSSGAIEPEPGSRIIDARGRVVMPGFIDTHFHGSGGDDVMAYGAEGIRRISRALLKFGTTGYQVTTVAARHEDLGAGIEGCHPGARHAVWHQAPALGIERVGARDARLEARDFLGAQGLQLCGIQVDDASHGETAM